MFLPLGAPLRSPARRIEFFVPAVGTIAGSAIIARPRKSGWFVVAARLARLAEFAEFGLVERPALTAITSVPPLPGPFIAPIGTISEPRSLVGVPAFLKSAGRGAPIARLRSIRSFGVVPPGKCAFGQFLFRPPGNTRASFAARRMARPAARIVVFVFVAGHERRLFSGRGHVAILRTLESRGAFALRKPVFTYAESASLIAFSSQVYNGSGEESASKQRIEARL